MAVKMKTKRNLAIEKVPMGEPAQATILKIDNAALVYVNMAAPGFHYFYFIRGSDRVFLSPNYPIVRFKDTNVFVNRINVRPKVHEF